MGFSKESIEQTYLFNWSKGMEHFYPELFFMHHIPNGGKRDKVTAKKRLKAEGVKPGVPDVFLPVARKGFHGLYIEMKWGENVPSDEQYKWIYGLLDYG